LNPPQKRRWTRVNGSEETNRLRAVFWEVGWEAYCGAPNARKGGGRKKLGPQGP